MQLPRPLARFGGAALAACACVAVAGVSPAFAQVSSPAVIQPTAGTTQVNLIGFNDFHGRINDADRFAANVLTAQAPFGEANTLILGNGDQVGATVFESAALNDQPTIDALNALGVESYTMGNHEFDKGAADAVGRIQNGTNGPDLAANVTDASGAHPFGEYALFTVNGKQVAVIGAVTSEVPSLVSPDGITGYTFEDPVAAVNRVAAQLSDGNPANGEADVIVASYHDGGPVAGNDQLQANMANTPFAHMVNDTVPAVDAIFNAHTHMAYAYDAPIGASTRPVIQADSYGTSIAQVVLTIDANNNVTLAQSSVIPTPKAVPTDLANDPTILKIQQIMADAVAQSGPIGAQVIATQTADLTRAKQCEPGSIQVAADGTTSNCVAAVKDDRANESALGGVVANSMLDSLNGAGHPVDIAMINPGGLRADIMNDGQVTYKEAASVLPFANTLMQVELTGADLKQILEEQWQPDGSQRPYLQLGLSDGFTYTYDPDRPRGDRILSMSLNGTFIDPAKVYHVAAPSFLATGGDNFAGFKKATLVKDTGLIDLESFVKWVKAKGQLPIDNNRNGVIVPALADKDGYPYTETVKAGSAFSFGVAGFDLASLGYTQNSVIKGELIGPDGARIALPGEATVTDPNIAGLEITIPENLATGQYTLVLSFDNSDTVTYLPLSVEGLPQSAPTETAQSSETAQSTEAPAPAAEALAGTGAELDVAGWIAVAAALAVAGGAFLARRRA